MSIATLILGESGTGKSASLRNLDPATTLLIQAVKKPLPFRSSGWSYISAENKGGNIFVSAEWERIIYIIQNTKRKFIVIDDFQYVMAGEFMARSAETGYTKFTELAKHAWDIFRASALLPDDVRVYILSHTQTDDYGHVRAKTIGKLLDEKITIEGLFTIVLRTLVDGGEYWFTTQNNGNDTVKSPIGLFESNRTENDLLAIDGKICEYYNINQ